MKPYRPLLLLILFASFSSSGLASGEGSAGRAYHITISDAVINPVTAEYISDAIERAESEKAAFVIIQLDTPGGLLQSTRTIVKAIMNANLPVVVYVSPRGARAGSAGVFITMAAHIAAMAPSTNIGAAHPVSLEDKRPAGDALEEFLKSLKKDKKDKKGKKEERRMPPEPMEQKILSDTIAWAKTIANERGRNADFALRSVTESISITETEALKKGVIDIIAANIGDLLEKLSGRTVALPSGEKVTLRTKDIVLVEMPMNFRSRVLTAVAHPNIILILMMLGFYGLLFEFTNPGFGFPGVAGAICLILAFLGMQVLPINYAGAAMIILAIILFIAEIKVMSYGLLTVGGVISLLLGSLILFPSPYEFMQVSTPLVLSLVFATTVIVVFLIAAALRAGRRKVQTGIEGLIGEAGRVYEWSGRGGRIFVHGELWDAEGAEELKRGDKVEVVKVEGMKVIIKRG